MEKISRIITILMVMGIGLNDGSSFFGTLKLAWYPEITGQIDMIEYLKENSTLMTTGRVSFRNSMEYGPATTEAIVGKMEKGKKYYTLAQCIMDLFTRDNHRMQLIFDSINDLKRVVELLMLKDDQRIWIHLDLIPLPNTTIATSRLLSELNDVLRWKKMALSVGTQPIMGNLTEVYGPSHAQEMKQITEQSRAMNMTTVFVVDGYVAQKQANFKILMNNLLLLERVRFLLRIRPDKEDKVVVKDLNETLFAVGGKFRAFLDVTPRLRQIVLNVSPLTYNHPDVFMPDNVSLVYGKCPDCKPLIIRKYLRCSGITMEIHWIFMGLLGIGMVLL